MKILFRLREVAWAIVSEVEDWLYPYRTDADKPLWAEGIVDDEVDEIGYLKRQIQCDAERIERLQSEMIYVTSKISDINSLLNNLNNPNQSNEGQEGSKTVVKESKETS